MKLTIHTVFLALLFVVLLLSFYTFVTTLVFKKTDNKFLYQTWQFPMLLALFLDAYYINL
jgi:hypothetical protein